MPPKTRTRKTNTKAAPVVRVVPDALRAPTDAEQRLWNSLQANPNSTAADLTAAATVARSTVSRTLTKWANDKIVIRTAGIAEGGGRAADLWRIADQFSDSLADQPAAASATPTTDDAAGSNQPTVVPEPDAADDAPDAATTSDEPGDEPDKPAGLTTGQPDATAPAATPDTPTDAATPEAETPGLAGPDTAGQPAAKSPRLAPGALRGMVEDFLRDNPDGAFSPSHIGKQLNRSSGAVNNALEKLVMTRYAVKVQDTPKRFSFNSTE